MRSGQRKAGRDPAGSWRLRLMDACQMSANGPECNCLASIQGFAKSSQVSTSLGGGLPL
jgi:hypothetical protein